MKKKFGVALLFVLVLILVVIILNNQRASISSFEECAAAGYPIMESYPRQCAVPGGETFVEDISVGGQRDSNGCLVAAGYSWNSTLESCVRQWEIDERNYINEDPGFCATIQFLCAEGLRPFFDSTGCGCESESARQDDVCSFRDREAEVCLAIYDPVCGWFNQDINCVKYPCAETYSNSCVACQNEDVLYYTEGECPS
jgi:hypothetical protein